MSRIDDAAEMSAAGPFDPVASLRRRPLPAAPTVATLHRARKETLARAGDTISRTATLKDSLAGGLAMTVARAGVATTEPTAASLGEPAVPPGPLPTEEQMKTLSIVADTLPVSAWLVVSAEFAERFAYYGVSAPFQNYISIPYPTNSDGQRGGLGLGQATATAVTAGFQFLCYITPVFGAIVSDSWGLGKLRTILLFCGVYVLGLAVLVGTSVPALLATSTAASLTGLIIAMVVLGMATGGIKPSVSPFVADQYPYRVPFVRTKKNGQKEVVDPGLTIQRVFSYFCLALNVACLTGVFAATYAEMYVGFYLAYLLPSLVFLFVIAVLLLGWKSGTIKADRPHLGSSVLVDAWKVIREVYGKFKGDWETCASAVREKMMDPAGPPSGTSLLTAADPDKPTNIDDRFVRDLYRALGACKVFVFFPFFWVVYAQITSNLISQAGSMETNGVPNDVIMNLDPLFMIAGIPLFDRVVYPSLMKMHIRLRLVFRISLGFFFSAAAMAWSAWVQQAIYNAEDAGAPGSISVWLQVPAYFFIACSEIFASITGLELAYSRAPETMKTVVMALFLLTSAFGSAIQFALVPISQDPYLVWMYGGLAVASAAAGALLYGFFRYLDLEDAEKERRELETAEAKQRVARMPGGLASEGNDRKAETASSIAVVAVKDVPE
ncbi:POT family-domain-containing protein [Hyaloraphidium curvatum]|nr:POT family-domain-containing protein [Hyaloraphidium curvatum]